MSTLPHDTAPDATPAFLRDGYLFVSRRCDKLGSNAFRARLMLQEIVCIRGRDAAEFFYGGEHFTRQHAMPPSVTSLLQGTRSVQALDGDAHAHRKRLFMDLMHEDSLERIEAAFRRCWSERFERWSADGKPRLVLHEEARLILTQAVLDWTGVDRDEEGTRVLAHELSEMIDGAASFGPHYVQARYLRERCERWAQGVIRTVRERAGPSAPRTPVLMLATHRDPEGELLDEESAAVELINLLRPTVAIGRYIVFLALELHRHPDWRTRLAEGPDDTVRSDTNAFVQEVRRTAPFFPVIAGRALNAIEWHGHTFAEGDWVMLDLYGTNRDSEVWEDPQAFRPERFPDREIGPFDLVPQGGGDFIGAHRCPGEWITIRLMEVAVRELAGMNYTVPAQDLGVDLSKMPARPADGFVIAG